MYNDPTRLMDKKIVFSGLQNAGKTSFLIALHKKYNFYERVESLKPTIMIDYSSFNFLNRWVINCWDMGGQEKYRTMFSNNTAYFADTDFFVYLIDIQDEQKFEESLGYLSTLAIMLEEQEYPNDVIVCFNKFDPKLKSDETYFKLSENLKTMILAMIPKFKFQFFNTSIYDISSLSNAMSYSLNKLLNLDAVSFRMERMVQDLNCTHAILYTDYGLIIADYYGKPLDSKEFEEIIVDRINENLVFIQKLYDSNVEFTEILSSVGGHAAYLKKLKIESSTRNTIIFLNLLAQSLIKEEVTKYVDELQDVLEEVLI